MLSHALRAFVRSDGGDAKALEKVVVSQSVVRLAVVSRDGEKLD
jgi:hypothetical protein